jgi:predicted HAD superfamily Cof-like phosphohydrolase
MKDTLLNWYKHHKRLIIVGGIILLLVVIGSLNSDSAQRTTSKATQPSSKQESTTSEQKPKPASPEAKPAEQAKTKLQELKELSGKDATLFVANSTELKEASSEAEVPFKIVINHNSTIGCSAAKTASYTTIKSIYTDKNVRDLVDQIVITYPGRLVTSLSGIDGRSIDSWSGETNFYKVMFDGFETSQRDPAGQKTWVVSINSCR